MELLAACQIVLSILQDQKLSTAQHDQVRAAYFQIAPKCEAELNKAKK
jgi:hypothetical protein